MGRRSELTFPKKIYRWPKKHIKRCSTSLIIREMQIKNIMKYHLIPTRITIIKKCINNKFWRCEEREHFYTVENSYSHCGE